MSSSRILATSSTKSAVKLVKSLPNQLSCSGARQALRGCVIATRLASVAFAESSACLRSSAAAAITSAFTPATRGPTTGTASSHARRCPRVGNRDQEEISRHHGQLMRRS